MGERRFIVRTWYIAVVVWAASAGAALADPTAREFWPEIDTCVRVSNAWRLSVFVPISSKNLETHYHEGNLVVVSRHP